MAEQQQTAEQKIEELFGLLMAPFTEDEVKVRTQAGRQLQYITARTVANRLDDTVGPANWWDEYLPMEHSVICKLTIRLPNGEAITKSDAGGYAGMQDQGDDDKSGYSDAFKRAAVKWGVGRYLYRDGIPRFAMQYVAPEDQDKVVPVPQGGGGGGGSNGGGYQRQSSPPPRQQQHDDRQRGREEVNRQFSQSNGNGGGGGHYDPNDVPTKGAALISWALKQKEAGDWAPINAINAAQKEQGFPKMLKEWTDQQIAQVRGQILGSANSGGSSRPAPAASRSATPAPAGPIVRDYNGPGDDGDIPF